MRFKIDENLCADFVAVLLEAGHDAMTVGDQGLSGKSDAVIAEVCKEENRVLVTGDLGFGNVQEYPPEEYSGLIVIRMARPSRRGSLDAFRAILGRLSEAECKGKLWIVEESRVRIRGN